MKPGDLLMTRPSTPFFRKEVSSTIFSSPTKLAKGTPVIYLTESVTFKNEAKVLTPLGVGFINFADLRPMGDE